ncbi:MAG: hypothetical protein ACU0AU_06795 [Cognatishimia activa]
MTKVDFFGVPILTKEELAEQQWEQFKEESRSNLPPEFASLSWSPLPSADEASEANVRVARSFMRRWKPGVVILESDTATGKSRAAVAAISERVEYNPNTRVLVIIDRHTLVEETRIKFEKQGVKAAVYRGAEADDPTFEGSLKDSEDDPDLTLNKMCKRFPARAAARKIGSANLACTGCPFNPLNAAFGNACSFKQQSRGELRNELAEAQVVIVSGGIFIKGNKLPTALKRKPSWRRKTFDHDSQEWVAKEGAEERGTKGNPALDFTHVWIDELDAISIAMGAETEVHIEQLARVDRYIEQGLALGVDLQKMQSKFEETWKEFELPGDVSEIKVEEWLPDRCDALRKLLSKKAFDGTPDTPSRITLGELEDDGLSLRVLIIMLQALYGLKVSAWSNESDGDEDRHDDWGEDDLGGAIDATSKPKRPALGGRSVEQIEEDFAPIASHNSQVRGLQELLKAMRGSASRMAQRNVVTKEEVSAEAFRLVDSGETGGIHLDDLKREMRGRNKALPGITTYQKTFETEAPSIGSVDIPVVKGVQRDSLGGVVRCLPTLITAAAQDHELVRAALGAENIEFEGDGRVRDGEGVVRAQSHDNLFAKSKIVPEPKNKKEMRKNKAEPIYGDNTMNAVRVGHDALVAAAMSGHTIELDGPVSRSEGESAAAGLITHKGTRSYIKKTYRNFEGWVEVGHFGATTGSNDWEGVSALTIAGRQAQDVRGVEAAAEVIFEREIERIEPDDRGRVHFERRVDFVDDRESDIPIALERETHPDLRVDTVRDALTAESLLQAEARGRAARRTAGTPLVMNIATSAKLDRRIDEYYGHQDWRNRTGIVSMLLALGVFPASTADGSLNLKGFIFQLIGRAGVAALGNETGALPYHGSNPALLIQDGKEVTPSACSLAYKDHLADNPTLEDTIADIEKVLEFGDPGKRYVVAGMPMVGGGCFRVAVTIKGKTVEVLSRGKTEAIAQRWAERVLMRGLELVEGAVDGLVEVGEVQIPVNATARTKRTIDKFEECAAAGIIPLTGGAANMLFPELWAERSKAKRDLASVREACDGAEIFTPEMDDAVWGSVWRAIFESATTAMGDRLKSIYKSSPNKNAPPKKKVQKWPGVISPKYDGSERFIADAHLFASLYCPGGGAVVRFTQSHKSAKPMEVFVSMPQVSHVIKKVLKGPDPLAAEKAHAEKVENATSLKAEKARAVKVAKAELEEAREAAKVAKEQFDAGLISKADWRAAREAQAPLREALAYAREQSKLARIHVAQTESKKPEAKKSMNTLTESALGAIIRLLGTEKVDVEVVALIPPGLEIDMNPVLHEAELDQEETQPEEELTEEERVELERIELELHIEHLEYVKARHEEMLVAGLKASIEAGNLPCLEELEAELCPP